MIIVDVETSGVNPNCHSLVSIGAIDFNNSNSIFFEECRVFDGAKIEKDSLLINGMTHDELFDINKKSEKEMVRNFISWMEARQDHTIAGQNPFFDTSFIEAAANRGGLNISIAHRIIDLHSIVYFHMLRRGITPPILNRRTDLNSDRIMEYVGIPVEPKPHIAINGAKWEAEAFSRLINEKSLFREFEGYKIPWL